MPRSAFALALALAACSPEPPNDVAADDAAVDSGAADSNDAAVDSDDLGPTPAPTLVETLPATALGLDAVSVNGRVQPRGRPTRFWFELIEDHAPDAPPRSTAPAPLPARPTAHYRETWDHGYGGFMGGMGANRLEHHATGGVGDSGFVRYASPGTLAAAHADGRGANELVQFFFPRAGDRVPVYGALGGGDPDFRGATIAIHVRGQSFVSHMAELVFWLQSTPDLAATYDDRTERWSNWAYSGAPLTDALASGAWTRTSYTLHADTRAWTYAGHYVAAGRDTYLYVPLDRVLGHLNGDIVHMITFFDYGNEPEGAIDLDELQIDFAETSLLAPANGGLLVSAPPGLAPDDSPARLTDGWRFGPGHTWTTATASASTPVELVYRLQAPLVLTAVELHQNPDAPTGEVEVLASRDALHWDVLARGTVPATHPEGDNFAFFLYGRDRAERLAAIAKEHLPWRAEPAAYLKVRLLTGALTDRRGLGEIALYGEGAALATEDAWVSVTADFDGLTPGASYRYRVVAESNGVVVRGPELTFEVPATRAPLVETGPASRVTTTTAKVEGRVSPLGEATNFWFDYGPDPSYGRTTFPRYAGLELTPRLVTDLLPDLAPGTTWHFRLVAENASGRTVGADRVVTTPP